MTDVLFLALLLAGVACLCVGAFLWCPAAGFATVGASCVLLSVGYSRGGDA